MVFLDRSKGLHGSVPNDALSGSPLNSHIGYKTAHILLRRLVRAQQECIEAALGSMFLNHKIIWHTLWYQRALKQVSSLGGYLGNSHSSCFLAPIDLNMER